MHVKLIRRASIQKFVLNNARSKSSFNIFQSVLKFADWKIPNDIKETFGKKADLICEAKRVVFDVGGGNYRVICGIEFRKKNVFLYIKFIGTHSEYSKLCNVSNKEIGICEVNMFK